MAQIITISNRYQYHSDGCLYEQGNMKIFLGNDTQLKQDVTIKVLEFGASSLGNVDAKAQIANYRLLKGSACENIMEIKEIIESDSKAYIIGEWCERGSLKPYIKNGFLDEKDALLIFKQVVNGLKEYHDKGITHGFVQLNNILVANGYFKLSNFAEGNEDRYLAPEVSSPDKKTKKSDIWSLGILLFLLLKGDFPFQNGQDILGAIKSLKFVFDEKSSNQESFVFPVTISKRCQQFISRMLSVNPSERPSLQDLLRNSILDTVKITYTASQRQTTSQRILTDRYMPKYTIFLESAEKNDINGLLENEIVYFGLCQETKMFVKIKQMTLNEERSKHYLPKLNAFAQINNPGCVKVYDLGQNQRGNSLILFEEYANQGSLNDFLMKRKAANLTRSEQEGELAMRRLLQTMTIIQKQIGYHGSIHIKNVFVHNGNLKIGEPLNLSQNAEVALSQQHQQMDFFAPEYKRDLVEQDPNAKLDKADVWSYGMLYYTILYGDLQFDQFKNPKFPDQASRKNQYAIQQCLQGDLNARSDWQQVQYNLDLDENNVPRYKQVVVQRQEPPLQQYTPVRAPTPQITREMTPLHPAYIIRPQTPVNFDVPHEEDPELHLIPVKPTGGERLRKVKQFVKAIFCITLLLTVFFRLALVNCWDMIGSRYNMKRLDFSILNPQNTNELLNLSIITDNPNYYKYGTNSSAQLAQGQCLNNFFDPDWPNYQLIDYIHSAGFFCWAFFCFVTMIFTCIFKAIHMAKLDEYTVYINWQTNLLAPYNKYLMACQVWSHFDFAFLYYVHYHLFSFFYYTQTSPCLGVTTEQGVQMLFDSTIYLFKGQNTNYLTNYLFTLGLFGYIICIGLFFYIRHPIKTSGIFTNYIYLGFRIVTYIIIILVCRFGALAPFQPQVFNDPHSIISSAFSNGEFMAVIGFIPEIMEIFLILLDLLIEGVFYFIGQNSHETEPYDNQNLPYQFQNDQSQLMVDNKPYKYDNVANNSLLPSVRNSELQKRPPLTEKNMNNVFTNGLPKRRADQHVI
ncbi:hypothetical protein ABPG74_010904 [Tetrahymena malaccensis]